MTAPGNGTAGQQGSYTFVPWFRRGIAAGITAVDDPAAQTPAGRAGVAAELTLGYVGTSGQPGAAPTVRKTVELVGPGDISALKTSAILAVYPPPDTTEATPGEFAYVEFYDEDLPWRYTPARPATVRVAGADRPRLRPWLALFVLADGEYTAHRRDDGSAVVTVRAGVPLPPADEAWAWAHAQLVGATTAAAAGATAATDPDATLSRLLSPRRLRDGVRYAAFLVPAFETGRLAGLRRSTDGVPALRPSWGASQPDRTFPVYHTWSFTTGTDGSFESYVRRLSARAVDDSFGKRKVQVDLGGYGLDPSLARPIELEGALAPLTFPRDEFDDGAALADALATTLDQAVARLEPGATTGDDPGVVPPVYGRWHAGVTRLLAVRPDDDVAWIRELNLDLRQRASAGLGAQVVRDQQDELMARAWAQVGALRDANQRLREAELAVAASEALFQKHFEPADENQLFLLSAAAHHGIAAAAAQPAHRLAASNAPVASLRATVTDSVVPSATGEAAFKRLTRPAIPLVRQATGTRTVGGFRKRLIDRLNDGSVTSAPPVPPPLASTSLQAIGAAVSSAATRLMPKLVEPKRVFWELVTASLNARPGVLTNPPTVTGLRADVTTRLAAWAAAHPADASIKPDVSALIAAISRVELPGDGTVRVIVSNGPFTDAFGEDIDGKSGDGVTIMRSGVTPSTAKVGRFAPTDGAADFAAGLSGLAVDVMARMAAGPPAPEPIDDLAGLTSGLHHALRPAETLAVRVGAALPGFAEATAERAAARARRLAPVLAYPVFPDPMVEALRRIDREHVLPNVGALPADTVTVMRPNTRFIEAYLAGLNTAMARELLWQEYPTDQRGSYFRVFWSRSDALAGGAGTDVAELPAWTKPLGGNGTAAGSPLVLVIRSELLRKFPGTVVYAQAARATATGRTLDVSAPPVHPAFHASLDPDVTLIGFPLTVDQVRGRAATGSDPGHPGMYFVLAERPGQVRFGLDPAAPPDGLRTWDDLSWAHLTGVADHLVITGNTPAPAEASTGAWATTSADLAAILFRSPVMYARHGSDMLPREIK
ncbi:hypothetical protein GA0074695_4248 [Micromonospora viridifaciens]|uniref:Uncharacterized protein n=1 Tax=Micromonospora viridifaciens TaxID=1881 RepID=A0A1C4YG90_MICVI|nr:hypothetical protein [Micromonospora viridifaciens]SCF19737.1 hypothetical protein GA0074695_4248 [Micromonospora viridifaciens]